MDASYVFFELPTIVRRWLLAGVESFMSPVSGEIEFQHSSEAVGSSGLGDGPVSSKQTMATGGHIEADAGSMR